MLLATVLLSAAPMAAHAQSSSAEDLTRRLNGGPPAATRPAPATTPTPTPAPTAAAPVRPTVAPTPRPAPAPGQS
ncbi:hypothetical protein, partial [Brevundimonas sp.]|uniref:hypothetical protein n=1 Tax=Brevundimonas sp. TaxID=1871086 RepID=UPI003D6D9123